MFPEEFPEESLVEFPEVSLVESPEVSLVEFPVVSLVEFPVVYGYFSLERLEFPSTLSLWHNG